MMKLSQDILIMVDIETLSIKPSAVVTQLAFMAVPMDDPDERLKFDAYYLPIQPQIDAGRHVDARTLVWWMGQSDKARAKFVEGIDGDSDTLVALVRSFIRKITQVIQSTDGVVEIWASGPQFDIVLIESLIDMCGESVPWKYNTVRDLRTLLHTAGVSSKDVDSTDIVPHVALEDCRFQIRCYQEAHKQLLARG